MKANLLAINHNPEALKLRSARPGRKRRRAPPDGTLTFSSVWALFILSCSILLTSVRGKFVHFLALFYPLYSYGKCAVASNLGQLHEQSDLHLMGLLYWLPVI